MTLTYSLYVPKSTSRFLWSWQLVIETLDSLYDLNATATNPISAFDENITALPSTHTVYHLRHVQLPSFLLCAAIQCLCIKILLLGNSINFTCMNLYAQIDRHIKWEPSLLAQLASLAKSISQIIVIFQGAILPRVMGWLLWMSDDNWSSGFIIICNVFMSWCMRARWSRDYFDPRFCWQYDINIKSIHADNGVCMAKVLKNHSWRNGRISLFVL